MCTRAAGVAKGVDAPLVDAVRLPASSAMSRSSSGPSSEIDHARVSIASGRRQHDPFLVRQLSPFVDLRHAVASGAVEEHQQRRG